MSGTSDLRAALADLNTTVVGRQLEIAEAVASTNTLLVAAARAGAPEGLAALCDVQLAGRGRRGRAWASPPGASVLCSVLLRPAWLAPTSAFALTLLGAVAAAEAIEQASGVAVTFKWPNDLQHGPRKLGGLLIELEASGDRLSWAVVGCGINVSWDPTSLPELADRAASLAMVAGRPIARAAVARALLERLDARYLELQRRGPEPLWTAWRARLATLGQAVRVTGAAGSIDGWAIDVDQDGALLVRDDLGFVHRMLSGEVSLRDRPAEP